MPVIECIWGKWC